MAKLINFNGRFCESDYEFAFISYLETEGWQYLPGNKLAREEIKEVLREPTRGGPIGKIVERIDVLDRVDAVAAALHLDEHRPLRALAHPGAEEILPRLVVRAQGSTIRERARAVCGIDLQQHVHQLPERRGPLHVVVLALVDAPGLRAVAGSVGELRDVVAVAKRHLAEYRFGLRRKAPRRDIALRAVVQHGAAELADVPVEGIAVVAHVRVFNVEATVLHDLRVGTRIEIALGVVEHAQGEVDDRK